MYSLKVNGQIEVIKVSEFEGKKTVKVQMVNITDKNIDVLTVKLLESEKVEDIKKGVNCEIDVKLFTIDKIKDKSAVKPFRHLLGVTENGVGKRTDVYLYPLQKRGGIGVKVANLTSKTGNIAAAQVVSEIHDQVILVSKKAVTIKLPLKNIPTLSRNTKGVILMRFKTGEDKLTAMTILEKSDIIDEPEVKSPEIKTEKK